MTLKRGYRQWFSICIPDIARYRSATVSPYLDLGGTRLSLRKISSDVSLERRDPSYANASGVLRRESARRTRAADVERIRWRKKDRGTWRLRFHRRERRAGGFVGPRATKGGGIRAQT